ncbi:hypothetical protein CP532_5132 [Ophiocordyceps camponoti-leonardi (nom. inval.)]|nr:hypothetical protein CP532_5132 [Ophiocordyceps camponoti-leonardi (nom. inval.)]
MEDSNATGSASGTEAVQLTTPEVDVQATTHEEDVQFTTPEEDMQSTEPEEQEEEDEVMAQFSQADNGAHLRLGLRLGDETFVKGFFKNPCTDAINQRDEFGNTALHKAAAYGSEDIGNIWWYGGEVGSRNNMGRVPLHLAAENGHYEAAECLLDECEARLGSQDDNSQTPLHLAAIGGWGGIVDLFLSRMGRHLVNIKDKDSRTALFYAVRNHDENMARKINKVGVNIDEVYEKGHTLLHRMALEGDQEAVRILVELGANKDAKDSNGLTPMYLAAQAGRETVFRFLHQKVADGLDGWKFRSMQTDLLKQAIQDGHLTASRMILRVYSSGRGDEFLFSAAQRNEPEIAQALKNHFSSKDGELFTRAAQRNDATAVAVLREVGCRLEPVAMKYSFGGDETENHPLYNAFDKNHEAVARALVAAGADLQSTAGGGQTLLHTFVNRDARNTVDLLIEMGADLNAKDKFGWTPLHYTVKWAYSPSSFVEALIDGGADLAIQDNTKQTALHLAVANGHFRVLVLLIAHDSFNSFKNIVDSKGRTALHICAENSSLEAACMLVDEGVDIEVKDENGQTPLHIAAARGRHRIVSKLLAVGADTSVTDHLGRSPCYLARTSGKKATVKAFEGSQGFELIPTTQNEYFALLHTFVRRNLQRVVRTDDDVLYELAKKATTIVPRFRKRFGDVLSESAGLARLMLYDIAIFRDASSGKLEPTEWEPVSHDALSMDVDMVTEPGVWDDDSTGTEPSDIDELEACLRPLESQSKPDAQKINSQLFTKLMNDIVGPMVIRRIRRRQFERPLIVLVITDEKRDGSPHDAINKAAARCEEYLAERQLGKKSVVFLSADVNADLIASSLLGTLDEDEPLRESFCFSQQNLEDIIKKLAYSLPKHADEIVHRFNAELVRVLHNAAFE